MIVLDIEISDPLDSIPRLMDLSRRHGLKVQRLTFSGSNLTIILDAGENGRLQGFAERVREATPVLRQVSVQFSGC